MERVARIIMLVTLITNGYGQAVVPVNIRATNTLEKLFDLNGIDYGDILYGVPLPEGRVIGDTYLDGHWKNSTILLYEKEKLIEGYPVRYDIYLDELEVKAKNGIKVLPGKKVKSFVWADSLTRTPAYFVNASEYKNEDDGALAGFFEVLSDGSFPLFKKTVIDIKKADYNIQFNIGSPDDKILKKNKFYAVKRNQVVEVPSSRKKFLTLFDDNVEMIEKFIKDNNLTTSKEEHLKVIFQHYNSLHNN